MTSNNMDNYHNVIRQMIKHEDEVRNQRTNWFLIIQGFLVAGFCTLFDDVNDRHYFLFLGISIVGFLTSLSFHYAAWRSLQAVTMALACWERFLKKHQLKLDDFPPVALITKDIIKNETVVPDCIGENQWNSELNEIMLRFKGPKERAKEKRRNEREYLLPFRFLPKVFMWCWGLLSLFALYKVLFAKANNIDVIVNLYV